MPPISKKSRARLSDVAELGGVAKTTASRIMSGDETLSVNPDTRARVLAAAKSLGYIPHAGARALAGAKASAIALLIPDITNQTYSQIVRNAYSRALHHGYVLLLAEDRATKQTDEAFTELVEARRVDGLMIGSATEDHLFWTSPRIRSLPHVFFNREVKGSNRNVSMNLKNTSHVAIDYLYELGHRSIAHIAGPGNLSTSVARESAFVERTEFYGLDSSLITRQDFSESGGAEGAYHLITKHPEITAIYVSVLSQAIGVIHMLTKLGLSIPGDISVIASDDHPVADYLIPPLTTVKMPLAELGSAAVDAVIEQINGSPARDIHIDEEALLVIRNSTGPAKHK
ncbi:TPA: LacI family DNA-binding transcriptional regulator [Klebsiella pneumoniae]